MSTEADLKSRILKHLRNAIEHVEKDSPVMADEEIRDAKQLSTDWFWQIKDRVQRKTVDHSSRLPEIET